MPARTRLYIPPFSPADRSSKYLLGSRVASRHRPNTGPFKNEVDAIEALYEDGGWLIGKQCPSAVTTESIPDAVLRSYSAVFCDGQLRFMGGLQRSEDDRIGAQTLSTPIPGAIIAPSGAFGGACPQTPKRDMQSLWGSVRATTNRSPCTLSTSPVLYEYFAARLRLIAAHGARESRWDGENGSVDV